MLISFFLKYSHTQDFEVAPVVINFHVEPGSNEIKKLTVRNYGNKEQTFRLTLGDFYIDKNGKRIRQKAGENPRSCANWLSINPSFFKLNPNEEKIIDVILTVPKGQYGTKWCYLYVNAVQEQTLSEVDKKLATGIVVNPRISVQIFQSPLSNKKYSAKIKNLVEVTDKSKDTSRVYEVEVENTGDKIIRGKVYLLLANIKTAKEQKFPAKSVTVFPGSTRKITLQMNAAIPPGQYALAAILDYGHNTPLEGVQIMLNVK